MKTRIIFIGAHPNIENAASYQRINMLIQMAQMHFECEVLGWEHATDHTAKHSFIRPLLLRLQLLRYAFQLFSYKSKRESKVVIFPIFADFTTLLLIRLITWFCVQKLIFEKAEYTKTYREQKSLKWFLMRLFILPWLYRMFDGIFVISDALAAFYSTMTRASCIISKVNMSVDFSRFIEIIDDEKREEYIFYAGSLSEKKDGVETLVKAFSKISSRYPKLKLKIAAHKSGDAYHRLCSLSKELDIEQKIEYLGFLSPQQISNLMQRAKLLVLPRPDSLQAQGGFPSKLGEYLASKTPVIATSVGDIPKLLSDEELTLIPTTNIEHNLEQAIEKVLGDYPTVLLKAEYGYIKAKEIFSIETTSKQFADFINKLK